jgi:hypothetical protein
VRAEGPTGEMARATGLNPPPKVVISDLRHARLGRKRGKNGKVRRSLGFAGVRSLGRGPRNKAV